MGFDSPEALAAACDVAHEKLSDIRTEMKSVEAAIAEKKEFRNYVLNYHKTRYVIDELKACKNEKARQKYRDEHDSDFIILNAAKRYFDSKGLKKLPSHKALQTEVEQLIKEKTSFTTSTRPLRKKHSVLMPFVIIWSRPLAERLNTRRNRKDNSFPSIPFLSGEWTFCPLTTSKAKKGFLYEQK